MTKLKEGLMVPVAHDIILEDERIGLASILL